MRISIIIPTYNRREYLEQSLFYISKQETVYGLETEVIVVDDGSTDSTNQVIPIYKTFINNLVYIYRPRDSQSNISLIRNLGFKQSTGDFIVFLDCGVLIPPYFLKELYNKYRNEKFKVIVHYVYGLFVPYEPENISLLADLSPENLPLFAARLNHIPQWMDVREELFDLVGNDLDKLPAPWGLCWGAALTICKNLADKASYFDESFFGWGSEDTDFGYSLYEGGASFSADKRLFVLHIPHPVSSEKEKKQTNIDNRKKLHKKKYKLDTELYPYYPGLYYQQVLNKLNHMIISDIIPRYTEKLLEMIQLEYIKDTNKSLLIGHDNYATVRHLKTTHLFAHNQATLKRFEQSFPDRIVNYLFGCDTPFDNRFFDIVIVTDFFRTIGPPLIKDCIKELYRISKTLVFIYKNNYVSVVHKTDGHHWLDISELQNIVDSMGFSLERKSYETNFLLLAIRQ